MSNSLRRSGTGDPVRFRSLDELLANQLLERKPPDSERVRQWLARSRRDLDLARDVLAGRDRDRAMAVAYEAGYRACSGLIALAGFRVTSQPGHHRAAIEASAAVIGPTSKPLLRRIDGARRFRNEILYGDAPPAAKAEMDGLINDVSSLLDLLAGKLAEAAQ